MSSAIFFFVFFAIPLPTLSKDYEVCKSVLRIFFLHVIKTGKIARSSSQSEHDSMHPAQWDRQF